MCFVLCVLVITSVDFGFVRFQAVCRNRLASAVGLLEAPGRRLAGKEIELWSHRPSQNSTEQEDVISSHKDLGYSFCGVQE